MLPWTKMLDKWTNRPNNKFGQPWPSSGTDLNLKARWLPHPSIYRFSKAVILFRAKRCCSWCSSHWPFEEVRYTVDRLRTYYRAEYMDRNIHTYRQFIVSNSPNCMFFNSVRKIQNQLAKLGSNTGPSRCEVTVLTAVPPCSHWGTNEYHECQGSLFLIWNLIVRLHSLTVTLE